MFINALKKISGYSLLDKTGHSRKISSTSVADYLPILGLRSLDPLQHLPLKWPTFLNTPKKRTRPALKTKLCPQAVSMVSQEERLSFKSVFPDIVQDLTQPYSQGNVSEALRHFTKVLNYNVPNGELSRGLAVVTSYKMLISPEDLTSEKIHLANILGWCAELLQASLIIDDDIMDSSLTRRGLPCWYIYEDVGMSAINDAEMLANGIFLILKKYFSNHRCYVPLMELVHEVNFATGVGQSLDTMCFLNGKPQLELFTMQRFRSIAKYKTGHLAYRLPMSLALYLAGKHDPAVHKQAADILLDMGYFHQIENDVLDCFGDSTATGKDDTDIQEGKCTWLIVEALQRATRSQRKMLENCYGKRDSECTNSVKALYEEMDLPKIFAQYEEQSYNFTEQQIRRLTKDLPQELFYKYLEKTYRRKRS